jgi:hypothetical protein
MRRTRLTVVGRGLVILTVCLSVVASASAGFLSCRRGGGVSEDDIQRAQSLLVPFKQELQEALKEGLRDGPEGAIDVCRVEAPRIAAALSTDAVTMGRTSHRLRNAANAPEPWMEALLADYLEKHEDASARAVRLPDGSLGYTEPIYVQPLCLVCHGRDIAPTVAERIDAGTPKTTGEGSRKGISGACSGSKSRRLADAPGKPEPLPLARRSTPPPHSTGTNTSIARGTASTERVSPSSSYTSPSTS